jgi:DNA ligase-1
MSVLAIRFHRGGVHLPKLGLWLDPHEPQTGPERVFVSHAHSDHIGSHREVILSQPTSKLMHSRIAGDWQEHVLPFNQAAEFTSGESPFRITLLPAGHIFGSAMALIEAGKSSLLYTGDFKLRPGRSAETCEPRTADVLVMETTYGRPMYQFPPTAEVLQGIVRFCREALNNEETPVLLGYSLGKSQELLCGLWDAGLPITLHGSVYRLTKIYEEFGQCFPAYAKYDSQQARGTVLICPPNVVNSAMLRNLGATRIAVLTGWAVDANCRFRYQAHAAFPLSDHADFPDLLELVKKVNPKRVLTLHGFAADFAGTLRQLGYDAQALSEEEQLALPLLVSASAPKGKRTQRVAEISREPAKAGELKDGPASEGGGPANRGSVEPGKSETKGSTPFHGFAETCSKIGATPKKLEKTALLAYYLKTLSAHELGLVSTWFTGNPFAPIENKVLQLGWAIIRDALCTVVEIDQGDFGQFYLKHSDLGETAFEMLLRHQSEPAGLTIPDIEKLFLELLAARGPLAKLPLLTRTLERCSALEGKYLVKILTGDLRIGLKEGLVEEALAQAFATPLDDIKKTNLLLGNIAETARLASNRQLAAATLTPFRPVKFMLASPEPTAAAIWKRVLDWSSARPTAKALEAALPLGPIKAPSMVWLEDKYDGIRCQVHKVGNRVALYSRDLREITTTFLDVADALRVLPADFIADGELVAMRGQEVLPFSELQKRLGRRESDLFLGQQIPVQFVGFDLLWLNGKTELNEPLSARRARLQEVVGTAMPVSRITHAYSAGEIENAFVSARERGNEGLMIKDPASTYAPGRRGLAWLKLKKAYATLDCVVVGAEYGHGKRKDVLSDYTFAVRDEATDELRVIGKAYSGLTDAEIEQLTKHFLSTARRQHGRYLEVPPDTVLEIAFDAVQPSERHSSGLALRFPRIARIRKDKSLAEIDTLETAKRLVKTSAAVRQKV